MLETFFIYYLMFFSSVMFIFASENCRNIITKHLLVLFSIIPLFLVSGLRENTGADYENYVYIYNNLDYYHLQWPLELGFYYLNKLYSSLGLHVQFIFLTMAFIQCLFLYLSLIKVRKPSLFLTFYILLFYLDSLNIVRQSVAMSIVLYSCILLLYDKSTVKFFFLIGLASFFHNVSLIFAPLFFVRNFHLNKNFMLLFILTFFLMLRFNLFGLLINPDYFSGTKYEAYFFIDEYSKEADFGSGIGIIFQYFIIFPILFFRKKNFESDKYNFVLIFNALVCIAFAISMKFYIFNRVLSALSISLLLSVELIYLSKINVRKLILLIYFLFSFILFSKDIYDSFGNNANKRISPYISILDGV